VKFGKDVAGSVVKVPEKFGFNWSIFGWFGHFTEHVVGEILGFRRNGHMRSENPPEGAKNLQGYTMGTIEHIPPTGFIGFDKNLKNLEVMQKGEDKGASAHQNREGGEQGCSPRGRGRAQAHDRRSTVVAGGRRGEVAGGCWESPETEAETERAGREKMPLTQSGWRPFFKTRYGRTGQSTMPVRCTPDSAQ
jgi:hypothetical protein